MKRKDIKVSLEACMYFCSITGVCKDNCPFKHNDKCMVNSFYNRRTFKSYLTYEDLKAMMDEDFWNEDIGETILEDQTENIA